jgi:hypothetical protein
MDSCCWVVQLLLQLLLPLLLPQLPVRYRIDDRTGCTICPVDLSRCSSLSKWNPRPAPGLYTCTHKQHNHSVDAPNRMWQSSSGKPSAWVAGVCNCCCCGLCRTCWELSGCPTAAANGAALCPCVLYAAGACQLPTTDLNMRSSMRCGVHWLAMSLACTQYSAPCQVSGRC